MAQTVVSGSTAYLTAEELFVFIDSRQVASMLRDDEDADLPTVAEMVDDGTDEGAILAEMLAAGSGEVEAACLPRGQYSAADLAAIYASETNAARHLKRVTAGCTILALFGRRHTASGAKATDYLSVMHAQDALERLRVGEHVFGVQENIDSGKGMGTIRLEGDTAEGVPDTPTIELAERFFGKRGC